MTQNNNPEWNGFENLKVDNELFPTDLRYTIKSYPKNELIFCHGDVCDALYILIDGLVKTEMITESGNILGIEMIRAPRPLAPAFLFSDNNQFPVDVTTLEASEILRIPKDEVMRLMTTQPDFMKQFLIHNANRTQFLINRLQLLSIKTIKGKLAHFLLESSPGDGKPFEINRNQTELADFFGVARPSLARSLSEMEQECLVNVNKKVYTILNSNGLRRLLI